MDSFLRYYKKICSIEFLACLRCPTQWASCGSSRSVPVCSVCRWWCGRWAARTWNCCAKGRRRRSGACVWPIRCPMTSRCSCVSTRCAATACWRWRTASSTVASPGTRCTAWNATRWRATCSSSASWSCTIRSNVPELFHSSILTQFNPCKHFEKVRSQIFFNSPS